MCFTASENGSEVNDQRNRLQNANNKNKVREKKVLWNDNGERKVVSGRPIKCKNCYLNENRNFTVLVRGIS